MTPLRQFKGIPRDIVRKAESKQFVRALPIECEMLSDIHPYSHGTATST